MKKIVILLLLIPLIVVAQKPQLVIKNGIQSTLTMASISPDNKLGITIENNESLILWELQSGKQLQTYKNVIAGDFGLDSKSIDIVNTKYEFKTIDFSGKVLKENAHPQPGKDKNNRLTLSYYRDAGLLLENGNIYTKDKGYLGRAYIQQNYGIEQDYSPLLNLISIPSGHEVRVCKVPVPDIVKVLKFNLFEVDKNRNPIEFTRFSANGKYLMAGNDYAIDILDINTSESIFQFKFFDELDKKLVINVASFSPDGKRVLILCTNQAIMFDLVTKKEIWRTKQPNFNFNEYGQRSGVVKFSDDGNTALIGDKKELIYIKTLNGDLISKIFGLTKWVVEFQKIVAPLNQLFIDQGQKIMSWNLESGALQKTLMQNRIKGIEINKNATKFYDYWAEIDSKTGINKDFMYQGRVDGVNDLSLSADNKLLLHTGRYENRALENPYGVNHDKLIVADVATKKILWRKNEINTAKFSNTSAMLATVNNYLGPFNTINLLESYTGKLIRTLTFAKKFDGCFDFSFSPTDKYISFKTASTHVIVEVSTGKLIEFDKNLPNGKYITRYTFMPNEKYVVLSDYDGDLYFYDILQQKLDLNKTFKAAVKGASSLSITKDNNYLFTTGDESNVKLWDLRTNELLATLYSFPNTADWAVITPNGQFDASTNAQKEIYFVKDINVFPLETLYEKYFTPKLLTRLLAGERFLPIDADFDNLNKAPIVKISYEQKTRNLTVEDDKPTYINTTGLAEITVNAIAENDKVDEIRLFHNGKAINLTTRGLFVTDNTTGTDSKKYTLNLLPGQNTIRAIALNSQRTESKPDVIVVNYQSNNGAISNNAVETGIVDKVEKDATLHLVVVGINKYQNEKLSLNYAIADATAFKIEIEKDAKTVLSKTKTYFVTDNLADKKGITDALTEVQKSAKPQDVFVFYYAGHGVISEKNKEFYLVPTDITDLKNVDEMLLQKGIPSKLLQNYAVDIQAQKQVFILDACQSAGAFEKLMTADANQQKSLAVVARSTGTHWIAASGAQQFANEFSQLGHGAFTYVLLQALKGEAANNKMITINGLKNFLQLQVPALMKKYNGSAQYPASYGFGNDFPVEVLK
jgi:WD40 repeat protein